MDLSKLKTSDWLLIGGGLCFFIFGFLRWFSFDVLGVTVSENAFDFFFTGTLPWVLVVGSGVLAVLLATGPIRPGSAPWPLLLLAATALGTLLVLLRLIFGREIDGVGEGSRSYGLWICLLASAAALAGAFVKFSESGGELRDLTDVDRLRGSFDRPDAPPPPPPPPRRQQPPPPPPPAV